MFTGLVEALGTIADFSPYAKGARMTVTAAWPDDSPIALGDSIAVSGACLTAVAIDGPALTFDLSAETLAKTHFSRESVGNRCNLERALQLGARLGGHMVTGHVDATAMLMDMTQRADAADLTYELPEHLLDEVVLKGSVCLDGVSLTVNVLHKQRLGVTIVPHTQMHTQLMDVGVGKRVHVETDVLGKHVKRLWQLHLAAGQLR